MIAVVPSARAELPAAIEAWARSETVTTLVRAFGGEPPADVALGDLLAWLDAFSDRWDFRAGVERDLAGAGEFDARTQALIERSALTLGIAGEQPPPAGHYDHMLILGGLVRGCLARPLHAAKLIADGTVTTDSVTALGGYRRLGPRELGLLDEVVGTRLTDEFEGMDAGVRRAFGVERPLRERGEPAEIEGAAWRVREYESADGLPLRVVAAPSRTPGRRANTADTYAWFALELAQLRPGQRILLVTTRIYVPFQHADAVRMLALPHGVEITTEGMDPGAIDERLEQPFTPANRLQEVRSTIRALRALHAAL